MGIARAGRWEDSRYTETPMLCWWHAGWRPRRPAFSTAIDLGPEAGKQLDPRLLRRPHPELLPALQDKCKLPQIQVD